MGDHETFFIIIKKIKRTRIARDMTRSWQQKRSFYKGMENVVSLSFKYTLYKKNRPYHKVCFLGDARCGKFEFISGHCYARLPGFSTNFAILGCFQPIFDAASTSAGLDIAGRVSYWNWGEHRCAPLRYPCALLTYLLTLVPPRGPHCTPCQHHVV